MAQASVSVTLVPGKVTPGAWCAECALPSGCQVSLYLLSDHPAGPSVMPLGRVAVCADCGRVTRDR